MPRSKKKPRLTLEEALQESIRGRTDLYPEGIAILREDLRLEFDYPEEYVAFIDSWKRTPNGSQLVRKILAHGKEHHVVAQAIMDLPAKKQPKAMMRYIDDPDREWVWG